MLEVSKNSPIITLAQSQVTPFLMKDRLLKYGFQLINIENASELHSVEDSHPDPRLIVVEISQVFAEKGVVEFVNYCKEAYPDCQIAATYTSTPPFPMTELFRNGMQHSFQLPFEEELLFNKIFEIYDDMPIAPEDVDLDSLSRVFMPEIENLEALPFDVFVFLPRNEKVIHYGKKGSPIDAKIRKKFGLREGAPPLYVRKNDLHVYRRHVVQQLKNVKEDRNLTEHERREQMRLELSRFVSEIFQQEELSATESQALLGVIRNTVMEYLRETSSNKEIFDRINSLCSERASNYNHAVNTAMYAALFSMLMGYSNTQDFVTAGLLHDIGLSMVDPEVVAKPVEKMSEKEFEEYKQHPVFSVDLISRKKIPASSIVMKTILQHHERPDGSGYPNGETEDQLHEFSRICAIADTFDELTSVSSGQVLYSPKDALEKIAGINGDEPLAGFDFELHRKLLLALMESEMDVNVAS